MTNKFVGTIISILMLGGGLALFFLTAKDNVALNLIGLSLAIIGFFVFFGTLGKGIYSETHKRRFWIPALILTVVFWGIYIVSQKVGEDITGLAFMGSEEFLIFPIILSAVTVVLFITSIFKKVGTSIATSKKSMKKKEAALTNLEKVKQFEVKVACKEELAMIAQLEGEFTDEINNIDPVLAQITTIKNNIDSMSSTEALNNFQYVYTMMEKFRKSFLRVTSLQKKMRGSKLFKS